MEKLAGDREHLVVQESFAVCQIQDKLNEIIDWINKREKAPSMTEKRWSPTYNG